MSTKKIDTKAIIIAGPHKSGTSAVAGVIHKLGIPLGRNLEPANKSNPLGHFEDIDFVNLNNDLLKRAGGSWHTPPSSLVIEENAKPVIPGLIEMLENKLTQGPAWGWKDPRTCLTLSVFTQLISDPYIVVVERNTKDTARSLYKRDKDDKAYSCTPEYALQLTKHYEDELNKFIAKYDFEHVLRVDYSELQKNPARVTKKIAKFIPTKVGRKTSKDASSHIKQSDKMADLKKDF